MNDKLLDKYTRRGDGPGDFDLHEPDEAEDLGSFGWLRGVRERALMLELRKRDGHVLAVGYAWIERVEYHPDQGITLHLPGRRVRIVGTGLHAEIRPTVRLLDGILRHRVPWIRESNDSMDTPGGVGAAHVERFEWEST